MTARFATTPFFLQPLAPCGISGSSTERHAGNLEARPLVPSLTCGQQESCLSNHTVGSEHACPMTPWCALGKYYFFVQMDSKEAGERVCPVLLASCKQESSRS